MFQYESAGDTVALLPRLRNSEFSAPFGSRFCRAVIAAHQRGVSRRHGAQQRQKQRSRGQLQGGRSATISSLATLQGPPRMHLVLQVVSGKQQPGSVRRHRLAKRAGHLRHVATVRCGWCGSGQGAHAHSCLPAHGLRLV